MDKGILLKIQYETFAYRPTNKGSEFFQLLQSYLQYFRSILAVLNTKTKTLKARFLLTYFKLVTARCYALRGLSHRNSVCLSVTLVDCVHMCPHVLLYDYE